MNIFTRFPFALLALLLPLCGSALPFLVHARTANKSVQAPPNLRSPQLIVQFGHTANINAVVVSRDGRYILSGGDDKTAILWDAEKASEIRRFVVGAGVVTAVAFSPDNHSILIGGGDRSSLTEKASPVDNDAYTASLWNMATGNRIRDFKGHTASISSVVFLPNGKTILTTSEDHTARLWDVRTGRLIKVLGNDANPIDSAVLLPNGRLILTAGGRADQNGINTPSESLMRLWDIATGRVIRRFNNEAPITDFDISPDGLLALSTSSHGLYRQMPDDSDSVRLWNLKTGKQVRQLQAAGPACFSPNGRFVLAGPSLHVDRTAKEQVPLDERATLWTTGTGQFLRRIEENEVSDRGVIGALAFRNDSEVLIGRNLTGAGGNSGEVDGQLSLDIFRASSGEFRDHLGGGSSFYFTQAYSDGSRQIFDVAFSRDGKIIMLGDSLWDTTTGRQIELLKPTGEVDYVQDFLAISPNARFALSTEVDAMRLWDLGSGREIKRFLPDDQHQSPKEIHMEQWVDAWFTPDSQFVLTESRDVVALWSTATGKSVWRYSDFSLPDHGGESGGYEYGKGKSYFNVTLSEDGSYVLIAAREALILLDAKTGTELKRFQGQGTALPYLAISPDNRFFITAESTFDLHTGEKKSDIGRAMFSPDGKYLLSEVEDMSKEVNGHWRKFHELVGLDYAEFSKFEYLDEPTEPEEPASREYHGLWRIKRELFESATGQLKQEFVSYSNTSKRHDLFYSVDVFAFSHNSKFILTVEPPGNMVSKWDIETGKKLLSFGGHAGDITSVAFSPDDQLILTGSKDGAARLWNSETGAELCTLLSDAGDWVVVSPDGRFDAADLDQVAGLNWIMPSDPMTLLPLEIFMRDYYEPRLLPRILKGEKFCEQPSLAELNPVQARVEKITVFPQPDNPGLVSVKVDVSSEAGKCVKDGKRIRCESGLYDLRLYRDGQLVGQSPNPSGETITSNCPGSARQEQFQQWRRSSVVKTENGRLVSMANGKQRVTFSGIRLPRRSGVSQVEFTAYAFNEDRVKSETSEPAVYVLPQPRPGVRQRAYLLTVGVDATSDPSLRLAFAPKGAREVAQLLQEKLASQYEVVTVPLISEYTGEGGVPKNVATKNNLQTVLSILSGRAVSLADRQPLPNQEQLRAATPDDLVVLYIASHGYADPSGKFYVVPSDIGEPAGISEELLDRCLKRSEHSTSCQAAQEFLRHNISSDELTQWLETVDSGDMVLVLDSCHSGAIPGAGFKPGPMGDRGFGQLSYDKGMLVLAATQSENLDWGTLESGDQSLLTYALMQQPTDEEAFNLKQWLSRAGKQVPELYRRFVKDEQQESPATVHQPQQPALFDFTRKRLAMPAN